MTKRIYSNIKCLESRFCHFERSREIDIIGKNTPAKILFIFALATMIIGCGAGDDPTPPPKKPTSVELVDIRSQKIGIPIKAHGLLSAKEQIKLSFKIGGVIESINVSEGAKVNKGQVLARINPAEINSATSKASTAFEQAKRDLQRAKNLYADSVATLEQLEMAQAQYDVAKADLDNASFNLQYAVIKAPSNGKILKKLAEANEIIGQGMPVLVMSNDNEKWVVRCGISESDIVQLQLGDTAHIAFQAYQGQTFKGKISEIAETLDPQSATYEVEIEMDKSGKKLINGFIADVTIYPSAASNYVLIPVESLVDADANLGYVFVPDAAEKTVKKVPVQLAGIVRQKVAVISGLEEAEKVVTFGAAYLEDGSEIAVNNPTEGQ